MPEKKNTINLRIVGKYKDNVTAGSKRSIKALKSIAKSALAITAVLGGIGIAAVTMAVDFNRSMANVATLIPGNVARIEELKSGIQDLSIETGKTAKDLSEGAYQIISAFGDTAETQELLAMTAKAATAGLASTTEAINLTSAVTKAFGDTSAEAAQKVLDLSFSTVKLGQTSFKDLSQSIGRVAPLASQLKVTQEEMFATFATLTGVTGKANEVSTQFAAILRAFMTQTPEMAEVIKSLGYDTGKALLADKGLIGALRAVIEKTDGTEEAVSKLFGSAESLVAIFALVGGQAETFDTKLGAMQDTQGAMIEAFKEQTEGINKFGFSVDQIKAQIAVLGQTIGDWLIDPLERLAESLKAINTGLIEFARSGKTIEKTTTTSGKALEYLQIAAKDTGKIFGWLWDLLKWTGNAVAYLYVAVVDYLAWWLASFIAIPGKIKTAWKTMIEVIKQAWSVGVEWLYTKFKGVANRIIAAANRIKEKLAGLFTSHNSPSVLESWGMHLSTMQETLDAFAQNVRNTVIQPQVAPAYAYSGGAAPQDYQVAPAPSAARAKPTIQVDRSASAGPQAVTVSVTNHFHGFTTAGAIREAKEALGPAIAKDIREGRLEIKK